MSANDILEASGDVERLLDEGSMVSNAIVVAGAVESETDTGAGSQSTALMNVHHLLALQAPSHARNPVSDSICSENEAKAQENQENQDNHVALQQQREMVKIAHEYSSNRVPCFDDMDIELTAEEKLLMAANASLTTVEASEEEKSQNARVHEPVEHIEKDGIGQQETTSLSLTGGLQEIPCAVLLGLLGHVGVDGCGKKVPRWAIDPYPPTQKYSHLTSAEMRKLHQREKNERERRRKTRYDMKQKRRKAKREKESEIEAMGGALEEAEDDEMEMDEEAIIAEVKIQPDVNNFDDDDESDENDDSDDEDDENAGAPMADVMFEWLCSKLHIGRPQVMPPALGDRGQHLSTPIGLKLDRLHCETTMNLNDAENSLVIVQALHGIISGQPLMNDNITGTPAGAMRYLPVHLIRDLSPGLCLVLYDILSGVTRVLAMQDRSLVRCAEAFGIPESNLPLIAQTLLRCGPDILRLSRVGNDLTGFSIDVNAYAPDDQEERGRAKAAAEAKDGHIAPSDGPGGSTMAHLLVPAERRPRIRHQGGKGSRLDARAHRLEMARARFVAEVRKSL